jgi:G2/mitotic-specific cyclin 3/4
MYSYHSNDDTEVESVPDYNDEDDKSSEFVSIDERQNKIINFYNDSGSSTPPPYRVTINHQCDTNPNALAPVWSGVDCQIMAELDFEFSTMPGVFDENDEDTYDISMAPEYNAEIFEYMRILELRYVPDAGYMAHQPDITWRMRTLLLDWIVRVHDHCNMLPETLFLTVNYIDRFLSLKPVNEQKLQLVGLVAMFVASKYEEITCPSVKEIAYLADNEYTIDEILRAERYMINLFDFKMGWPGPMSFLRRSSKADDYDSDIRTLAKYLLELTVMEPRLVSAPASWLAAAAHCLALRVLARGPWSKAHAYFSGYTEIVLRPAIEVIVECCRNPQTHHRSIFKKYSETRFRCVSMLVSDWITTSTSELD